MPKDQGLKLLSLVYRLLADIVRHLKKGRKFGMKRDQRKALLRGLVRNLILRGKIKSTLAKTKEIRSLAEKLITEAKSGSLASRRRIILTIGKDAASRLFSEIAPKMENRAGGYTRIIRLGRRPQDAAEMAIIELVK